MSRRIPITVITPSAQSQSPATIQLGPTGDNLSGDWTQVFRGRFYRLKQSPFTETSFQSSPTAPVGSQRIEATQFEIVDNPAYNGRYTVFTPTDSSPESVFATGSTTVKVNEPLPASSVAGATDSGFVTNVSTYYITVPGSQPLIIPSGTSNAEYAVELPGRNYSGYGESLDQGIVGLFTNFASSIPPGSPLTGTLWFDLSGSVLKVWNGSWIVVNASLTSDRLSFRHVQSTASDTWEIFHNADVPAPWVVNASFFVTVGGVQKPIIPLDIVYNSPNHITVKFSKPFEGLALIRP